MFRSRHLLGCSVVILTVGQIHQPGKLELSNTPVKDNNVTDNPDSLCRTHVSISGRCSTMRVLSPTRPLVSRPKCLPSNLFKKLTFWTFLFGRGLRECRLNRPFFAADTSFPTPMEEPKKVLRCHYLGTAQVPRASGQSLAHSL